MTLCSICVRDDAKCLVTFSDICIPVLHINRCIDGQAVTLSLCDAAVRFKSVLGTRGTDIYSKGERVRHGHPSRRQRWLPACGY